MHCRGRGPLRKKPQVSKVYVKNGTAVEGPGKCASCTHAHIVCGFRESEEITYCNFACDQLLLIPFKVRSCSNYLDRSRPTWEQMQELAIDVLPISSAKPAGFRRSSRKQQEEDNKEAEPETVNR